MKRIEFVHIVDPRRYSCVHCEKPAQFVVGSLRQGGVDVRRGEYIVGGQHSVCSSCITREQVRRAVPEPTDSKWQDALFK